ncbi:MAG: AMP-binding protein [Chitinophagales bacterium]|nr:AMP-binding protein [Chitinophagales bacterium]
MKIYIADQIIEIPIAEGAGIDIANNQLFNIVRMQMDLADEDYEKSFWSFIEEWVNEKDYVIAHTSGSTGLPKEIQINKTSMILSARRTNAFFQLNADMHALLCMDCKYIGAKLMVIRALIGNLDLYITSPKTEPLLNFLHHFEGKIDFAAMVPYQLHHIAIDNIESLSRIDKLIIGGGSLPKALSDFIIASGLKTVIYETYGMTETISHIAIREMTDVYFNALPEVEISIDERGCAQIEDQLTQKGQIIQTNDIIELHEPNQFKILGRLDNIINTGGVKISPEIVEEKIKHLMPYQFLISSMPDAVLGNKMILIYELNKKDDVIAEKIKPLLSSYEMPKEFIRVDHLIYLENLKIDRIKSRQYVLENLGSSH